MKNIATIIQENLLQIEADNHVRVLYACESGSRAWGFPSVDSDYDVRFIYVRERDWYLSINVEHRRDVIELPIDDSLDISGWDLRKVLGLLAKSNPPLLEWMSSPIVYKQDDDFIAALRELAQDFYRDHSCMYHYLNMARGNFKDFLRGDTVKAKKYFYVLRPLLGVLWLERNLGIVPMEFQLLVEGVLEDGELKRDIFELIEKKKSGAEMDGMPRIDSINNFLEREFGRLESLKIDATNLKADFERLNVFFREWV